MKKILMTQLTWLLLLTHMVFGTTYGPELIKDAGNENGSLKYRSQYWHGHFNMLRAYKGDTYLLTGNARYASSTSLLQPRQVKRMKSKPHS